MSTQWLYRHAGQAFGPYSTEELRRLAALGLLAPADLLWPEGRGPEHAIEASSAIDFGSLPPPRLDPPDWLADVERSERPGPTEIRWPALGVPDWLDDVRRAEGAGGPAGDADSATSSGTPQEKQDCGAVHERLPAGFPPDLWRRVQAAVRAWAALGVNEALILSGDREALRRDVAIQAVVRMVERGGSELVQRFWVYLESMVGERRKQIREGH
jgi:hypothetical protein